MWKNTQCEGQDCISEHMKGSKYIYYMVSVFKERVGGVSLTSVVSSQKMGRVHAD